MADEQRRSGAAASSTPGSGSCTTTVDLGITPDTWITSDHHFGHENIIRLCGRPANSWELMVRRWREAVQEDDVILHLGDIAYKSAETVARKLLRSLPGQKFLILGNHDKRPRSWYEAVGFTVVEPFFWYDMAGERVVYFSHRPDDELGGWDVNVHGHIHNNGYPPTMTAGDRRNVSVEVTDYTPVRLRDVLA